MTEPKVPAMLVYKDEIERLASVLPFEMVEKAVTLLLRKVVLGTEPEGEDLAVMVAYKDLVRTQAYTEEKYKSRTEAGRKAANARWHGNDGEEHASVADAETACPSQESVCPPQESVCEPQESACAPGMPSDTYNNNNNHNDNHNNHNSNSSHNSNSICNGSSSGDGTGTDARKAFPITEDDLREMMDDTREESWLLRMYGKKEGERTERELAFERFYEAYPRKTGKGAARQQFLMAISKTDPDTIMRGLLRLKDSYGWTKEGGRYVPAPANFLRDER